MPKLSEVAWASLLIIGIGSWGTWHYSRKLAKAMRTEMWQPVAGEIMRADMTRVSPAMPSKHYVDLSYSYRVNGQVFESDRISWANTGSSGIGLYRQGETVTVYVNPLAPHEAVLIQGPNAWTYVQISLCATFASVGIWLLIQIEVFTVDP